MSNLIVSVSGIRGIVGEGLTPAAAPGLRRGPGDAHRQGGRIVLSRDGRPSGGMLRHAVLAGLLAAGCEVHDLGVAPTPTVGLAVRTLQAAGGIQITASHNPAQWNGLKLFGPDGAVLTRRRGPQDPGALRARRRSAACRGTSSARSDDCRTGRGLAPRPRAGTGRRRRASAAGSCSAFLDANGGAGGPLGRRLLEAFQVPADRAAAATPTASSCTSRSRSRRT